MSCFKMVLTFAETKELEELKHTQEKEILDKKKEMTLTEHNQKMTRLEKIKEITLINGTKLPSEY